MLKDIIDNIGEYNANACVMDYDLKEYHTGRIDPLSARITALEKSQGHDGRELEIKKNYFPPLEEGETPAVGQEPAIIWRHKPRDESDVQVWNLLIFEHELKGDKGDQGDAGEAGRGINLKGVVDHLDDLFKPTLTPTPVLGDVFLIHGVDEAWVYYTNAGGPNWQYRANWHNLGKVAGVKGDRGPRGPTGPKGSSGSISQFLLSWIVDTVTNQALTAAQIEVSSAINAAIETMANQLANLAEDAAEEAVKKAMEDAYESLKGDSGEKGDKGEDGKDGKDGRSFQIVGSYSDLWMFRTAYPLITANVGKAAIIKSNPPKEDDGLWAITESTIGTVQTEYFGEMQGPKGDKGEDADWTIRLYDEHNSPVGDFIEVTPVAEGVANLFVQGKDGIIVEHFQGANVGFTFKSKYPIPAIAEGVTNDKVLSNNGTTLKWVDLGVDADVADAIQLRSPNGTVFEVTVTNDGRLKVKEAL